MPLYRGHVEISSGQVYYGHTEVEDGYKQVAKFYENDPNITVTLNVIDNITGGTQYTVGGDLTGATSTGLAGQSYAFNTTVTADAGYYFTSGPTINNASGTYSTSQTVNTTLGGNVAQIPPNQCVATAVVQNNVTNGSGRLSFTTTPPSVSRACPNTLQGSSDFSTTATITDSNYQWGSGPSFSYPTNTINSSQNVTIVATGQLDLKQGAVSLAVTDSVTTSGGAQYTLTCTTSNNGVPGSVDVTGGANSPVQLSGGYGQNWSYTMSATPTQATGTYGYIFSSGPSYNWNSGGAGATATLSSTYNQPPTLSQTLTVTGAVVATIGRTQCTITDNISAPAGAVTWQVQYKIGAGGTWTNYSNNASNEPILTSTVAGEQYIWQAVITLNAGFTWTQQGSSSFSNPPGSTTTIVLGSDAIADVTLSGSAIASMTSFDSSNTSRGTCALACADSATATYYHDDSSGMGTVEPSVGDYVYTNSAGGSGNALPSGWYRSGAANFSKYAYQIVGATGLVQTVNGPGSTCGGC